MSIESISPKEAGKTRKAQEIAALKESFKRDGGMMEFLKKLVKKEKTTSAMDVTMEEAERENTEREMDAIMERLGPEDLKNFLLAREASQNVINEINEKSRTLKSGNSFEDIATITEQTSKDKKISPHLVRMNIQELGGGTETDYSVDVTSLFLEAALVNADTSRELEELLAKENISGAKELAAAATAELSRKSWNLGHKLDHKTNEGLVDSDFYELVAQSVYNESNRNIVKDLQETTKKFDDLSEDEKNKFRKIANQVRTIYKQKLQSMHLIASK